jgi:hypothetical protein
MVYGDPQAAFGGVRHFDTRVSLTWDEEIDSIPKEQFEKDIADAFERGVVRAGAETGRGAPNYLWCSVHLMRHGDRVTYSARVCFRERVGQVRRWVQTWDAGFLGVVSVDRLDGSDIGRACAKRWGKDWQAANQPS